uniref:Uncharacterized protein n=1 Tax=Leersia perrieri TaxID=77586 RepID=A0A0D9V367_9ORYZ
MAATVDGASPSSLHPWNLLLYALGALPALWCAWQALDRVWLRPRRLGRALRAQGLRGTDYRFLSGDMKEFVRLLGAAASSPMPPMSHDVALASAPVRPRCHQAARELICRWQNSVGADGVQEIDVWPAFQNLTGDVISRSAFGSSFSEGRRIFRLQSEQAENVVKMARAMYFPGFCLQSSIEGRKQTHERSQSF